MKRTITTTCVAAVLAAFAGMASAQTNDSTSPGMRVLPTETIGDDVPTPEAPAIARREAYAALAEAQRDCRRQESRDARRDCMQQAHDDFEHQMAEVKNGA